MSDDAAFIWDEPTKQRHRSRPDSESTADTAGRITLREAEHRFGVRVATLRTWARRGVVNAIRASGRHGEQWMVTPESVAHHLSRDSPRTSDAAARRSGPNADGSSMLVPRDAWDKLMDQLGNLHEAGMRLAEARERAAKAETEASFLRERLAELRAERDELKEERARSSKIRPIDPPSWWGAIRARVRRRE